MADLRSAIAVLENGLAARTGTAEEEAKYAHEVIPAMESVRVASDLLETIVEDLWRLPTYQEMHRGHSGADRRRPVGGSPWARVGKGRSVADHAVDALPDEVGVAVVTGVLLDHVEVDPAQRDLLAVAPAHPHCVDVGPLRGQ